MSGVKVLNLVWKLNTGGAERMLVNYHNYFVKSHGAVTMKTLCFSKPCGGTIEKEIDGSNDSVVYIPLFWGDNLPGIIRKMVRRLFYPSFRRKWLFEQVKQFSPDIIHIYLANLAAEFAEACNRLPKSIKIIYHLHSMPETINEAQRRKIERAIVSGLYHPLCVTEQQRLSAIQYYHIPADAPVIYNGIDVTRFTQCRVTDLELLQYKKKLGIEEEDLVIGAVGRGAPVKNYPLIAKAAAIIAELRKAVLLIVGEIPQDLKENILKDAGTAKVIFTGQNSEMEIMYRLMDVFVLASFFESSSIVTVEAQLSGLPCVISDKVSPEVVISDGVTQLSPKETPEKWAEYILSAVGKRVKLLDETKFDFRKSAEKMEQLYQYLTR